MLIPSIDLVKGRAVLLRQGRELDLVSDEDPRLLAKRFGRVGEIAVLDVDAARGTGDNTQLIEELCAIARCRVGGGIREVERGRRLLGAGARTLIVGTGAKPEFLGAFPPSRLIAALDTGDDTIVGDVPEGPRGESPINCARRLEPYVGGFLYSSADRLGTDVGVDIQGIRAVAGAVGKPVTAAGNVRSVGQIRMLDRLGVDAQVGSALYRNAFTLGAAVTGVMDFAAGDGRLPTVVQDARDGRVLSVVHSTAQTLAETVDTGIVVVSSRGRGRQHAGEPSGATQRLVRVEVGCDRAALLFHVVPEGAVCDGGTASCFGGRPFSVTGLEDVIASRGGGGDASYTAGLLDDAVTRHAKILEEARELVEARTPAQVRRESADLVFHLLVDLVAHGVSWHAVIAELESRRRRPVG